MQGAAATAEDVLTVVRLVLEAKGPDYIYDPPPRYNADLGDFVRWPRYFNLDGQPEDIVGHVLAYHGYGPGDVVEYAAVDDRRFPYQPWFRGFDVLARALLVEIQRQQDLGSTLNYILERGECTYRDMVRCALGRRVDAAKPSELESSPARHP
jgi:hypothetical protein